MDPVIAVCAVYVVSMLSLAVGSKLGSDKVRDDIEAAVLPQYERIRTDDRIPADYPEEAADFRVNAILAGIQIDSAAKKSAYEHVLSEAERLPDETGFTGGEE